MRRGEAEADVITLEVSRTRPPLRMEVAGEAAELPNKRRALLPLPLPEIPPKSFAFADIFLSTNGDPDMELAAEAARTTSYPPNLAKVAGVFFSLFSTMSTSKP